MSAANRSAGRIIQKAVLLTNGVPNANFFSILVEIIPISDGDCFLRDEAKAAPRIRGITTRPSPAITAFVPVVHRVLGALL